MRHTNTTRTSATAITAVTGAALVAGLGMTSAEAKTTVTVTAPAQVHAGQTFTVRAEGGTDAMGSKIRLCVARAVTGGAHPRYVAQACTNLGQGVVQLRVKAPRSGEMRFEGIVYSLKDGHAKSTSTPAVVRVH